MVLAKLLKLKLFYVTKILYLEMATNYDSFVERQVVHSKEQGRLIFIIIILINTLTW